MLFICLIFPVGSITLGTSSVHLPPLSNTTQQRSVSGLIHTSRLNYNMFLTRASAKKSVVNCAKLRDAHSLRRVSLSFCDHWRGIWHQSCGLPRWQLSNTASWLISKHSPRLETVLVLMKNWSTFADKRLLSRIAVQSTTFNETNKILFYKRHLYGLHSTGIPALVQKWSQEVSFEKKLLCKMSLAQGRNEIVLCIRFVPEQTSTA